MSGAKRKLVLARKRASVKRVAGGRKKKQLRMRPRLVTHVQVPAANASRTRNMTPVIQNTAGGAVIRHSEAILFPVSSSNVWNVVSKRINPGLPGVFPWLSGVAARYDRYVFDELEFVYEPAVGTTQSGNVFLAYDSDPRDPAPSDPANAASYRLVTYGVPFTEHRLRIPRETLHRLTSFMTSVNDPYTRDDVIAVDVGKFHFCMLGQGNISPGTLRCNYVVRLWEPQIRTETMSAMKSVTGVDTVTGGTPISLLTAAGAFATQFAPNVNAEIVTEVIGGVRRLLQFNEPGDYFLGVDVRGNQATPTANAAQASLVNTVDWIRDALTTADEVFKFTSFDSGVSGAFAQFDSVMSPSDGTTPGYWRAWYDTQVTVKKAGAKLALMLNAPTIIGGLTGLLAKVYLTRVSAPALP